MKNFWKWILAAGFILVLFFLTFVSLKEKPATKTTAVIPLNVNNSSTTAQNALSNQIYVNFSNGTKVKVELAITPAEQEQGLSGRTALKENEGMLFDFEKPGKYAFWMKDMKFAIDMIWFDTNGSIVYIKKDAKPESYPATFTPTQDARYVLEVSSGFSDKNNLKVGDRVDLFSSFPESKY